MKFRKEIVVAGLLFGFAAVSARAQVTAGGSRSLKRAPLPPDVPPGELAASDAAAVARRWGVAIETLRLASGGYMLELRYRILDANKAQPLFDRGVRPRLHDDASAFESVVPTPPTTGALRSTYDAKAGRTYFMFFANPGRYMKAGRTATVTIGEFKVRGVPVTEDARPPVAAPEGSAGPAPDPAKEKE